MTWPSEMSASDLEYESCTSWNNFRALIYVTVASLRLRQRSESNGHSVDKRPHRIWWPMNLLTF